MSAESEGDIDQRLRQKYVLIKVLPLVKPGENFLTFLILIFLIY